MITIRNGYIEIPLPHLDTVVQTIRASVYPKSEKISLEMSFRKSGLYDLLKGKKAHVTSSHEDALLLFNLWTNRPDYLSYCVANNDGESNVLRMRATSATKQKADRFALDFFTERHSIFDKNAEIVGGMIDALGYSVAVAVYFGTYNRPLSGRDIINAKILSLTPDEVFNYKMKGRTITNAAGIKDEYLAIKNATNSLESVMFAAANVPSRLAIKVIENDLSFDSFMEIMQEGDSTKTLELIFEHKLDPFLVKALKDAESLGYSTEGGVSLGLAFAA